MSDYLNFPFQVNERGRSGTTGRDRHVRNMIRQVLFTRPGERVNRPEFGCGLLQLIFAPNNPALEATTHFTVEGALQRWLGDIIEVETVNIEHAEARLVIEVRYRRRDTGERERETFETGL